MCGTEGSKLPKRFIVEIPAGVPLGDGTRETHTDAVPHFVAYTPVECSCFSIEAKVVSVQCDGLRQRSDAVYAPKSDSVVWDVIEKARLVQVRAHGEAVNLPRTDTGLHLDPGKAKAHVGALANVRLCFDGFKVKAGVGSWQIDGFAVRPDLDKPGFFDNVPNHAVGFWGVYGVRPLTKTITLDAYYLGLDRKTATFNRGVGHEVRHSIGARLSRPISERNPGWDFDYEALWQFGTFGSAHISAWTVASETGYRFPNVPLKPRFSTKADISSGDDPRTNTLGTFNPLFPKGNYFGVLATAGPGPINFIDVHPRAEATLPHNVTASVDWIFQWRESLRDGVYSVPGFLIIPAGKSSARFVGHRPGTEVRWQANRHLWFQADYGIFYAGKFVKESQPGRNLNYWALWAGYKF